MQVMILAALLAGPASFQSGTETNGVTVRLGAAPTDSAEPQAQRNLAITNRSGHIVIHLMVSPSESGNWGEDFLVGARVGNGEMATVTFPSDTKQCQFDILAVYEDHRSTHVRNVDLCTVPTVTLTPD